MNLKELQELISEIPFDEAGLKTAESIASQGHDFVMKMPAFPDQGSVLNTLEYALENQISDVRIAMEYEGEQEASVEFSSLLNTIDAALMIAIMSLEHR